MANPPIKWRRSLDLLGLPSLILRSQPVTCSSHWRWALEVGAHQNQNTRILLANRYDWIFTVEHTRLAANREELDMLLSHIRPSVISLQETFLKENKTTTFKGYSSFHSFASEINGTPHGGSAILVSSSVPHTQLNLHMQACKPSLFV